MRTQKPATPENILQAAESLARNIASLATQVQRLADRIEPYEGSADRPEVRHLMVPKNPLPLETAMKVLMAASSGIESCERDFAAIRSKVERADEGAYLRDELAPWMKPKR